MMKVHIVFFETPQCCQKHGEHTVRIDELFHNIRVCSRDQGAFTVAFANTVLPRTRRTLNVRNDEHLCIAITRDVFWQSVHAFDYRRVAIATRTPSQRGFDHVMQLSSVRNLIPV